MKNKSFIKSVIHAVSGFWQAVRSERNLRIDIVIALLTAIFAYAYGLEPIGWAVLVLAVCAVFSAELVNTALERLSDAVTEEYNEKIKAAKDIAAAAVILTACGAVLVGLALFAADFDQFIMAVLNIVFSKHALAAIGAVVILGIAFILFCKEPKKS